MIYWSEDPRGSDISLPVEFLGVPDMGCNRLHLTIRGPGPTTKGLGLTKTGLQLTQKGLQLTTKGQHLTVMRP